MNAPKPVSPPESDSSPTLESRRHEVAAGLRLVPGSPSVWDPRAMGQDAALTTSAVLRQTRAPLDLPLETEAAILAALTRPIDPGEGHREGNARRERDLAALFSQLELVQAFDLGRRFDLARADDRLAQAFARLVVDRRQRLRAFLADARRRQALGSR